VIRTAYTALFEAGAPLAGYVHGGYFFEHSTPARYLQGNVNLLRGDCAPPGAPRLLQGIDPAARIDATAEITAPVLVAADAVVAARARVGPYAVVGRSSRVAEFVQLQQSVVWPDSVVDSDAIRQIITPGGRWSVD
jgi:NDP-sugar pyrophosphorylase family protein